MDNLLLKSAAALARAIREKWISSEELVKACINRIEEVNTRLNAVVQLPAEQALEAAREADRALARGVLRGPLHGVPFTLKDSIETKGVVCTGGTEGRTRFVPAGDATVAKRLLDAGGVLLGKTNCPELGWAWESDNLIYGRTNNPYSLKLSPGGSSGGESAIIAACGSPFGLGSDAGGSVRFPAHCTGIASIKPTSGRVPRTGHFPGSGGPLDTLWQIGPLARYVEDLALVLPIISGVDWLDAAIVPMPVGDPKAVEIKGLRVALHSNNGIAIPTPEVAETIQKAARVLAQAGVQIEEARPPAIELTYEIYLRLFSADGGAGVESLLAETGTSHVHPLLKRVLEIQHANACTMAEYGALVSRWDSYRSTLLESMEKWDAILCPVAPFPGMVHGSTYDRLEAFSYTMAFNLTGWPAAVVRAGMAPSGLPMGVQLAARPWREDVALALARCIEKELGGFQPPPI